MPPNKQKLVKETPDVPNEQSAGSQRSTPAPDKKRARQPPTVQPKKSKKEQRLEDNARGSKPLPWLNPGPTRCVADTIAGGADSVGVVEVVESQSVAEPVVDAAVEAVDSQKQYQPSVPETVPAAMDDMCIDELVDDICVVDEEALAMPALAEQVSEVAPACPLADCTAPGARTQERRINFLGANALVSGGGRGGAKSPLQIATPRT